MLGLGGGSVSCAQIRFCRVAVEARRASAPLSAHAHSRKGTPHGRFLVALPYPKATNVSFTCFVTAKHVLQQPDKSWLSQIVVRLNRLDGRADKIPVSLFLSGTNKNVYLHPDQTVGIAVIPFAPPTPTSSNEGARASDGSQHRETRALRSFTRALVRLLFKRRGGRVYALVTSNLPSRWCAPPRLSAN